MAKNRRNGNSLVVPGSNNVMEKLKMEIAAELGIENYDTIDKGALPARVHGAIGGSMTKRLIEMGEKYLAQQDPNQSDINYGEYVDHANSDMADAGITVQSAVQEASNDHLQ